MIKKEVDILDKYWNDLVYTITDGNAAEMVALKRFDIIDFFDYVTNKTKKHG